MKVLVVDDEPLVRRSFEKALLIRGHQVLLATNGREGLDIWIKEKPDLIFLDVLMPELTGPQVLQQIGNKKSGKVILISAYSGVHEGVSLDQVGADLFLSKPFDNILDVIAQAEALHK